MCDNMCMTHTTHASCDDAIETIMAQHACVASASLAFQRGHINADEYEWLTVEIDNIQDVADAVNIAESIRTMCDDCINAHAHLN